MRLVRVAMTSGGKPVVAWTARESARTVVRAAAGRGRVGFTYTPLRYGRSGRSCVDGLGTAPDGTATVLWNRSTLREGIVDLVAAVSRPGVDGFGAPEDVATGARAGASLGVEPRTGAAVAVWVSPAGALAYSVRMPDR